jgi:hypothetical protein
LLHFVEPCTTEKVVWWLGESKGFWVQTGALIISAIGGVLIILSRSKTERRRATVDLVLQEKNDTALIEAKTALLALHASGQKNFASFLSDKNCPQHKAIMRVLNTHEFVAGGIRDKAYDEHLYKRMQCSVMIRDWGAFCGFVMEFRNSMDDREKAKTFYQDFEWLATRWSKSPLRPHKWWHSFWSPW